MVIGTEVAAVGTPKIRALKGLVRKELTRCQAAHAKAVAASESVRWNTRNGMAIIRRQEYLAGRIELLEELLEWSEANKVPDPD